VYRNILVGFRNDPRGRDALELGRILAQACDAEMVVAPASDEDGRELTQIVREEEPDLVVLGSTHHGQIGRVIPGATVGHLLGEALCAVAVAPPGFADADDVGIRVVGVGYDGLPSSLEALRAAAELAVANGAALRVYTVVPKSVHALGSGPGGEAKLHGVPVDPDEYRGMLHEAIAELPPEARALPVFLRGTPALALIEAAEAGVDLMVLGSRSGGPVRRALHGSISDAVMRGAGCPVLISPGGVTAPARSWPSASNEMEVPDGR
jgi:nucleotide-binding universal stress UspA family protein